MLLLVAALMVLACVPRLAWAAETATITARVRVFQEYKVSTSGLQSSFEYVIKPVEADAPLPVDESGESFDRFKLTRDEELWLEFPVEVAVDPSATPYAYHYVLEPVKKELANGLYYVDVLSTDLSAGVNVYYLELNVLASSADAESSVVVPLVHIEELDGPKVTDPGWRIAYKAPSSDTNKNSSKSNNGSTTKASSTRSSTGRTSSSSLAQTGDPFASASFVAACLACAGILLLATASLLRRRAGEGCE